MESSLKRKAEPEAGSSQKIKTESCLFGVNCYHKNPLHFKEFKHPHLLKLLEESEPKIPSDFPQDQQVYIDQLNILRSLLKLKSVKNDTSPPSTSSETTTTIINDANPSTMLEKLENAAPYNVFFSIIPKAPETFTQPNSITFTDLLCPSLGQLKNSLQINFMIDIMWLIEQYKVQNLEKKPLTILHGDDWPDMKEYIRKSLPNVTYQFVKMKDPFGYHHSKIGIYLYEDNSLRVVVSTANLYHEDWNFYNQCLWMSPLCPPLPSPSETEGDSPTKFKSCLLSYLKHYNLPVLRPFIEAVKRADFSSVKVFLVTSIPGNYHPENSGNHVHQVGNLLSRHCTLPTATGPDSEGPLSWHIIAQLSSIGSLGKSPADWLRSTLLRSLSAHKATQLVSDSDATLSIVFPTVDNVMGGLFGAESGGCLPYSKKTNQKQRWLQAYLHQWKADRTGRTRSMPQTETYCRISPCLSKLAWFFITSANISKSSWGGGPQKDGASYVRNCEAGVMFLPNMFDEEYFEIENAVTNKNKKVFPFMYDLPLTEYTTTDYPWCN